MRNVINIGVRIVFTTTQLSWTGRGPHKVVSGAAGPLVGQPGIDSQRIVPDCTI